MRGLDALLAPFRYLSRRAKAAVLWLIIAYQREVSPRRPACCRYLPTCSQYALEAVERHGLFQGGLLALWRLLRCHPFSKGGFDPVPEHFGFSKACCCREFVQPPSAMSEPMPEGEEEG